MPGLYRSQRSVSQQWQLLSSNVERLTGSLSGEGEVTDPESGITVKADANVTWNFGSSGLIASEFSVANEVYLEDLSALSQPDLQQWLIEQARSVGMGGDGYIAQGFGVITSVVYARSGLNVGSLSDHASFSLGANAKVLEEMLGGGSGGAKFSYFKKAQNCEYHIWPAKAGDTASEPVPIAYTFASYDGTVLIPNWVHRLGALELFFNNKPGCTYITHIKLSYRYRNQEYREEFSLSGGMSKTLGNIPVGATFVKVEVVFQGVINNDTVQFEWATPLLQWPTGRREIEMTGVWPGATSARELG